ncbi:MAG: GNAT family N-acetyltransferase [Chloroflexi bacterium]|nr:GNAT family N-acetyltransferase [Chloroflexota bacterium]
MKNDKIIKEMGEGLILRRGMVEDAQNLAEFNAKLHSDDGPSQPDQGIAAWVDDLTTRPHPTFDVSDFTIVEDTKTGEIVSSMNSIPQIWSYAGIEFQVGRLELVGTALAYRNQGLVRTQFDWFHQFGADRGQKMGVITGIPYYYRQFGYEMGLALGGGRAGSITKIPKLKKDQREDFMVRPAEPCDIDFMSKLYTASLERQLVGCLRSKDMWNYELSGRSEGSAVAEKLRIIETLDGSPVGFLVHPPMLWGSKLSLLVFEIKDGISWLDVTPTVLRYLQSEGTAYAARGEDAQFDSFGMSLGVEHPVYDVIPARLPEVINPYAWYLRIADLPEFLRLIGGVLEQRLLNSPLVGHSGNLKLCFFQTGILLTFTRGNLSKVETYKPEHAQDGDVLFPDLTFLQVLFGYRSFDEVERAFADCYARNDHGRALVKFLFPKKPSNIWSIV